MYRDVNPLPYGCLEKLVEVLPEPDYVQHSLHVSLYLNTKLEVTNEFGEFGNKQQFCLFFDRGSPVQLKLPKKQSVLEIYSNDSRYPFRLRKAIWIAREFESREDGKRKLALLKNYCEIGISPYESRVQIMCNMTYVPRLSFFMETLKSLYLSHEYVPFVHPKQRIQNT